MCRVAPCVGAWVENNEVTKDQLGALRRRNDSPASEGLPRIIVPCLCAWAEILDAYAYNAYNMFAWRNRPLEGDAVDANEFI